MATRMNNAINKLKLSHFRQLIIISETGSIRKASEVLAISQPALSRNVRSAEEILQVKLINRGPRGVELTEQGKVIVKYGKTIEFNIRFAEEQLNELDGFQEGQINLGLGPFEGFSVGNLAINCLLDKRPKTHIVIEENEYEVLANKLIKGEIDLILGPSELDGPTPSGLVTEKLSETELVPVVRQDHPLADMQTVTLETLSKHDWILPPSQGRVNYQFNKKFIQKGLMPPKGPIRMAPQELCINFLKQRDLISLLPRNRIDSNSDSMTLKILDLTDESFSLPMQLTTRELGGLPPACRDLVFEIKLICKTLKKNEVNNFTS